MSNETAATNDDSDRLIRTICFGGLLGLAVLVLFVHLLLIYRS